MTYFRINPVLALLLLLTAIAVALPFISYGGTSVMFLMLEMGMVLSVSNQIKLEQ